MAKLFYCYSLPYHLHLTLISLLAHACRCPFLYPPQAGDWAHLAFVKKYQLSLPVGTMKGCVAQESLEGKGVGLPTLGWPIDKDPSLLCLLTDTD